MGTLPRMHRDPPRRGRKVTHALLQGCDVVGEPAGAPDLVPGRAALCSRAFDCMRTCVREDGGNEYNRRKFAMECRIPAPCAPMIIYIKRILKAGGAQTRLDTQAYERDQRRALATIVQRHVMSAIAFPRRSVTSSSHSGAIRVAIVFDYCGCASAHHGPQKPRPLVHPRLVAVPRRVGFGELGRQERRQLRSVDGRPGEGEPFRALEVQG